MCCYEHGGDTYGLPEIKLDFSVNIHPLGMPHGVQSALLEHYGEFCRYPDQYCRDLRLSILNFIRGRYKDNCVLQDNILCGNGASDLIFRICAALKPKKAVIPVPAFSEYEHAVRLFGGSVLHYRMKEEDGFALREDFLKLLTPDTDIVFLCNPDNPTGRLVDQTLLDEIIRVSSENEIHIVIDECFLQFSKGRSALSGRSSFHGMLVLNAFTKYYGMAGLRLGCLLGERELLDKIAEYGPEWNVSIPAQIAGIAALKAEPDWTYETDLLINKEREYMTGQLTDAGLLVFPSEANFLLIKSEKRLYKPLLEKGILVRKCDSFMGLDDRFIRIGLKTRKENDALLTAIREVLNG